MRSGRLLPDDLDNKILIIFDKSRFELIYSIAKTLGIAHSTMLLLLSNYICFRSFFLHWALHLLMHTFCEKRKEYAKEMLSFLHVAECDNWHHLLTGDES
jgi:hypothetical protein